MLELGRKNISKRALLLRLFGSEQLQVARFCLGIFCLLEPSRKLYSDDEKTDRLSSCMVLPTEGEDIGLPV